MERRRRLEELRRDLGELVALETAEKKRELEEFGEKQAEDELRILSGAEDREMVVGREAAIEADELSVFDPENVMGRPLGKKTRVIGPGDDELDIDDDVQEAKTVNIEVDEIEQRWK